MVRDEELYHWGIKGMKWGVRRYQNPDGTLTPQAGNATEKAAIKAAVRKNRIMPQRRRRRTQRLHRRRTAGADQPDADGKTVP